MTPGGKACAVVAVQVHMDGLSELEMSFDDALDFIF